MPKLLCIDDEPDLVVSDITMPVMNGYELIVEEATPVADYIIKEFGTPPVVPKGALSKEVQAGVKVAFIA